VRIAWIFNIERTDPWLDAPMDGKEICVRQPIDDPVTVRNILRRQLSEPLFDRKHREPLRPHAGVLRNRAQHRTQQAQQNIAELEECR
jgi:hypothetical protein